MGLYYEILEGLNVIAKKAQTRDNAMEWDPCDEELVEELGRWLARIAKAFAILTFAIFAGVYMGCF